MTPWSQRMSQGKEFQNMTATTEKALLSMLIRQISSVGGIRRAFPEEHNA